MQQGGSPYGAPPHPDNRTLFSSPPPASQHQMAAGGGAAETVVQPQPISTRHPPPSSTSAAPSYEELGAAEDPLGDEGGAGAGGGGMSGGGSGGNRWPRQETLALLKIRSDMDATFRDATLKGPLWEEVSRKLAELGYRRSAKKCKEKFENVHKYYKRTKEGRAGRQDGKSYRFFSQLEALHSTTATAAAASASAAAASSGPSVFTPVATTTAAMGTPISVVPNQSPAVAARFQTPPQQQISAPTPIATAPPPQQMHPMSMLGHEHQNSGAAAAAAGMSFTSNTSSDASESDGDEDDEATEEGPSSGKKRKREGGAAGRKMMAFFEGLMRQVMERQEAMQQRFLEAIEKREQDRMIRDEAWRRQEIARLAREQELAAGERAAAAARDAAVISFLQKFTGQTVPITPHAAPAPSPALPPPPPPPPATATATVSIMQTPPQLQIQPQQLTSPPSQPQQQQQPPPPTPPPQLQSTEIARQQYHQQQQQTPPPMRPTSSELVPFSSDPHEGGASMSVSLDPASSRWPKLEVHALIKLRSGLDSRYQESGPKGPLWEEISAGMQRLGYNRSAKRCKEKWENINKYFKKVKESNKKRPEDAKTCPYFHQLDALYRNKLHSTGLSGGFPALTSRHHEHESHLNPSPNPISVMPPPVQQQQQPPPPTTNQGEMDMKKGNGESGVPNNGGMPTTFYGDGSTGGMQKKPEDIVKELMGQSSNDYSRLDEPDSDNMDEDDDDDEEDDEDEEDGKGQYTIQFQRQNVGGGGANANANGSSSGGASTAPPSSGGKAAGSFLAMVR